MGRKTERFGLSTLGPGDSMADEGFKYSDADIELLDRLLAVAAEGHHHTGVSAVDQTPTLPLSLHQLSTGGGLPSSTRYYYKYTLVDAAGNESIGSPTAFADTPAGLHEPAAPALSYLATGGTLDPGNYTYVLSAYSTATSLETKAANSAYITVATATSIARVAIALPPLPPGATGFNIYRKAPNGARFQFLASTVLTGTYIDDGSIDPDCNRTLPAKNSTNNTGVITVSFPGATPVVPAGYTWKIYRTDNPNNWANSLLHHVVETTGATPVVLTAFSDVGSGTVGGKPPDVSQSIGNPDKVVLTDGSEVQGVLPPGMSITTRQVTFNKAGTVTVGAGVYVWNCPYDQAHILSVRAYLGVASWPAATPVIVDVNKFDGVSSWPTIFTTQANRPRIPVGDQVGATTVPNDIFLVAGDMLSCDVDQAGGGATPTDHNLTVSLLLLVKDGSDTVSPVF